MRRVELRYVLEKNGDPRRRKVRVSDGISVLEDQGRGKGIEGNVVEVEEEDKVTGMAQCPSYWLKNVGVNSLVGR